MAMFDDTATAHPDYEHFINSLSLVPQTDNPSSAHSYLRLMPEFSLHILPTIDDTAAPQRSSRHRVESTGYAAQRLLQKLGLFSQVSYGYEQSLDSDQGADCVLQLYVKALREDTCEWGFEVYDRQGNLLFTENSQQGTLPLLPHHPFLALWQRCIDKLKNTIDQLLCSPVVCEYVAV